MGCVHDHALVPNLRGAVPSAERRIPVLFVLAAALGCPAGAEEPAPPTGGLLVQGTPVEAMLAVNEQTVGPIRMFSEQALPLRPGLWRVEVSAPGYFPWYAEVDIADVVETIRVDLRPVPD